MSRRAATAPVDPSSGPPSVPPTAAAGRRRREHTRTRLLDAAVRVFAEHGLGGVTVDSLTKAAGFSRGAFYSNFSTIDEVFLAVVDRQSRDLLASARTAIESLPESDFTLESIGAILGTITPSDRAWFLLHEEFTLHALRHEEVRSAYVATEQAVRSEVDEVLGAALTRLGRRPALPLTQISETLVALYLHGLGTEHLGVGGISLDTVLGEVLPRVLLGLSEPL
ncbi:MAG: TetR/AcrR family transcriptional regulator [Nocardioides sp.]|nr:TetR/AcrR family transcriptional regulator [Nocardioides sp.]